MNLPLDTLEVIFSCQTKTQVQFEYYESNENHKIIEFVSELIAETSTSISWQTNRLIEVNSFWRYLLSFSKQMEMNSRTNMEMSSCTWWYENTIILPSRTMHMRKFLTNFFWIRLTACESGRDTQIIWKCVLAVWNAAVLVNLNFDSPYQAYLHCPPFSVPKTHLKIELPDPNHFSFSHSVLPRITRITIKYK